jgi:outer membrane receptor for Fe3+-dicitrate
MKYILSGLSCVLSLHLMAATSEPITVNGEVSLGLINNSALSVDELDEVSSQGDSGLQKTAAVTGLWKVNDKAKISASSRYNEKDYNEFDSFDLTLHQVSIDASYQWRKKDLGLRYDGAKAKLAGDSFLSFHQASIYLGTFLQPQTFLRTSAKIKSKKFAVITSRNANAFGASAELFHFINDGDTMFMLGVSADKETATDPQFDYNGYGLSTKLSQKFELFGLAQKVAIGWRFQSKDYQTYLNDEMDSQLESKADEHRKIFHAQWQLDFNKYLALVSNLEYGDYRSQLDSQTYNQTLSSLSIKAQF